jgi:hypothetical protein
MSLSLDNCAHCACVTHIDAKEPARAIDLLERGEFACWNCEDQQGDDGGADSHVRCVQLLDDEGVVHWDGRCRKE